MEKNTIAETLKPTFENVAREFITDTMFKILFDDELPNFKFEFREEEAVQFIEKILQEYSCQFSFTKEKARKILKSIKKKDKENQLLPTLIINDYKNFFELLRQFYEQDIELHFKRVEYSGLPAWEMRNCFEQIWLRATPNDFNDPEKFLRKQVQMVKDTTFDKYDKETYFGRLKCLDDNILCVKNGIARTWDESSREIQINIYDKKFYHNKELFVRPHYTLPVIRYGIYQKDGKKVCHIGSIQNIDTESEKSDVQKRVERKKYQINKDISDEDMLKVEPKKILSLALFINLLNQEGISEIEVPSMYVLDYDYHEKRGESLKDEFDRAWPLERKKKNPEGYKEDLKYLLKSYKKEDVISEVKTERFMRAIDRILYHYPKGMVKSYPDEVDNFFHIDIPIVEDKNEIRGELLQEIYDVVRQKYVDVER